MAICKRCAAKTRLDAADIEKMVAEVKTMKGVRLADEELYQKRLNKCRTCPKLGYSSTCMACGCVVEVRALLMTSRCPMKYWEK